MERHILAHFAFRFLPVAQSNTFFTTLPFKTTQKRFLCLKLTPKVTATFASFDFDPGGHYYCLISQSCELHGATSDVVCC